ncbi:MAG: hypothetical protein ACREIK_06075 [Nitrospiraceae bacterium]
MPVNMDPKKRRKRPESKDAQTKAGASPKDSDKAASKNPDEPDEADLAEKELTHLWDATEVIDMDKW